MRDEGGGSLIRPDGVVPSRIVGGSVSDISPCTIKSRRFLLAPAHPGGPGKRAVKRFCVCVCVCWVHWAVLEYENCGNYQTTVEAKECLWLLKLDFHMICADTGKQTGATLTMHCSYHTPSSLWFWPCWLGNMNSIQLVKINSSCNHNYFREKPVHGCWTDELRLIEHKNQIAMITRLLN